MLVCFGEGTFASKPKLSMSPKCVFFSLAVKYADQGDLHAQPVVFILHPDTPKLVIVSELVLNAQKDWRMNHHGSEFTVSLPNTDSLMSSL